jgi:hypothetical protein
MKLHRHIALVEVNAPAILDALEATAEWGQYRLRRLSDTVVAVQPGDVEVVAASLRRLGYLPRVIER